MTKPPVLVSITCESELTRPYGIIKSKLIGKSDDDKLYQLVSINDGVTFLATLITPLKDNHDQT